MATQIHGFGPNGELSPGAEAALEGLGGGGGVEVVSGTVTLDGSGSPVREFYVTSAATINGVAFDADTAVVFRRTSADVWGYIVVESWTDLSATTTTTTTAATTTTTTTASPYDVTETFEYATGTDMDGKTTTTGGLTWASDVQTTGIFSYGSVVPPTVGLGGRIVTAGTSAKALVTTLPQVSARISADYDVAATGGTIRLGVASTNSTNRLMLRLSATGGVRVYKDAAEIFNNDAAGLATTGRASFSYEATTGAIEVIVNGATVWSGTTTSGLTGKLAGVGAQGAANLWYDNVGIEYL